MTSSGQVYRLLCRFEELKREDIALARRTIVMVSDPGLRDIAAMVEAWSMLSAHLASSLQDYINIRMQQHGVDTSHLKAEDAGFIIRLASEYLSRQDEVIRVLEQLREAIDDGHVKKLVDTVIDGEKFVAKRLVELREQLEKEISAEKPRPEHD